MKPVAALVAIIVLLLLALPVARRRSPASAQAAARSRGSTGATPGRCACGSPRSSRGWSPRTGRTP